MENAAEPSERDRFIGRRGRERFYKEQQTGPPPLSPKEAAAIFIAKIDELLQESIGPPEVLLAPAPQE